MNKIIINATIFIIFIGAIYWAYTLMPEIQKEIIPEGLDYCLVNNDCVVFGETGDCNCGCYNKNHLPLKTEEECFCEAPISCRCVASRCEGVFEETSNFNDCADAGYAVMESYPRQCKTSNETFTEEHCLQKDVGSVLTLSDAKEIAISSECGDNLKETFFCNEITGAYWLDLNLDKEGCSPACVVDIENRTASINWRCTGLIQ